MRNAWVGLGLCLAGVGVGCGQGLTVERGDPQGREGVATVVVEPYAANVVRVTLSLDKSFATAAPGPGFVAKTAGTGWTATRDAQGDRLASPRMVVTVAPQGRPGKMPETGKFFGGSAPYVGLTVRTQEGATLLQLQGWQMAIPNYKDGTHGVLADRRESDHPF